MKFTSIALFCIFSGRDDKNDAQLNIDFANLEGLGNGLFPERVDRRGSMPPASAHLHFVFDKSKARERPIIKFKNTKGKMNIYGPLHLLLQPAPLREYLAKTARNPVRDFSYVFF